MQCPKCHRPLEDADDGVYICCADAVLQWRCMQCAKVSEGFAFPYGRCPQCGGELEMLDAREVDQAPALEGIRKAFEIELGRSEEHTSELQSRENLVCRLLLDKKN